MKDSQKFIGLDVEAQRIAWKAQHRLNLKYSRITARGKTGKFAVVAVARELIGFIWAIGCSIEDSQLSKSKVA
ncbi:hypothetical protein RAH41_19735 [Gottfriedia acidiceleris]|uniref:hypothetical protein n=1 Tax=Gottfriedia acidiceleris TaxID=371036 RepID=UPI002F26C22F